MEVGVELISTLLGKVPLDYEHNYIVPAFLYAPKKYGVRTPKIDGARGRGSPIFNASNSPQLSTSQITNLSPGFTKLLKVLDSLRILTAVSFVTDITPLAVVFGASSTLTISADNCRMPQYSPLVSISKDRKTSLFSLKRG